MEVKDDFIFFAFVKAKVTISYIFFADPNFIELHEKSPLILIHFANLH